MIDGCNGGAANGASASIHTLNQLLEVFADDPEVETNLIARLKNALPIAQEMEGVLRKDCAKRGHCDTYPWRTNWAVVRDAITAAYKFSDQRFPDSTIGSNDSKNSILRLPESVPEILVAAQSGDPEAQFKLAGCYWTGTGLGRSLTAATMWYEAAATNGNAEAAYNLGTIHEYGLGRPADLTSAIAWYRLARNRGHTAAKDRLQTLAVR